MTTTTSDTTAFPDRAPKGYVWVIAELVHDRFCPAGYLRTRPWLGRFWKKSEADASVKARRDAHNGTLVPVLIEDVPVVCEDEHARNNPRRKDGPPKPCGYFDCAGCDACKHVSADRAAARRISGDSQESPGAVVRSATNWVARTSQGEQP